MDTPLKKSRFTTTKQTGFKINCLYLQQKIYSMDIHMELGKPKTFKNTHQGDYKSSLASIN